MSHTVGKRYDHLEQATFPDRLLLSRDAAFPDLEVKYTLGILLRARIKAKGMILPPLLPEVREQVSEAVASSSRTK